MGHFSAFSKKRTSALSAILIIITYRIDKIYIFYIIFLMKSLAQFTYFSVFIY